MTEQVFDTFEEFLKVYGYGGTFNRHKQCIFRGEGSCKYKLLPSSLREVNINWFKSIMKDRFGIDYYDTGISLVSSEHALLVDFYERCNSLGHDIPFIMNMQEKLLHQFWGPPFEHNFWLPDELFELAGIAQHYGLPTRLLDWTLDINIALYFALNGRIGKSISKDDNYIALWIFEYRMMWPRQLYPTFKIIYPKYKSNPNITAQKGVFTLWQQSYEEIANNEEILTFDANFEKVYQKIHDRELLFKILINANEVGKIFDFLKHYGYTSSSLFPGFHGVVKSMKDIEKLSFHRSKNGNI